ncbi:MAG: efflux transporter outer membrane subunit [Bacteroidetes bacterium]|nr:MAG: efflux transporter outer membrane subunit [Bacteroidota bacterium]
MRNKSIITYLGMAFLPLVFTACQLPALVQKSAGPGLPEAYAVSQDSANMADINWRTFFSDPNLKELIDTALAHNQELNILLQEIDMARNEVSARQGEYLPFVKIGGDAGAEKVGRYTSQGANDANTEIQPGREFPDPLPEINLGAFASWEVDVWHKLRNARKSAMHRYLASVEGKNFMVTHLVAEIARSYYELLALDNQLDNLKQNIRIQQDALKIVRLQKQAARATELAVRRYEAEVLKNRSLQYEIEQQIVEVENRINFLVGRYPQPIPRDREAFADVVPGLIEAGLPVQLLGNRPDIRQAEQELAAAKLDVAVARADFYPSVRLTAGLGLQAFNPKLLLQAPESIAFSLVGDMVAPLINRKAIKAAYYNANARQIQAAFDYEQRILSAYIEVVNQLSYISNIGESYNLKEDQVQALTESITIANNLFRSARADYMEVLLTQRDALEARMDLIETKMLQIHAMVNLYQALGGGWE